jgi:hypothetical protein
MTPSRFRVNLMAALRNGKSGPPELQDFQLRQAFWERFGERLDDILEKWPSQQVEDYVTIMTVESEVAREKNEQGSSSQGDSQTTEAAYEAMRARAREGG